MINKKDLYYVVSILSVSIFTYVMIIFLSSCGPKKVQSDFAPYGVTLLFEYNGCKVYRYTDNLQFFYYHDCRY